MLGVDCTMSWRTCKIIWSFTHTELYTVVHVYAENLTTRNQFETPIAELRVAKSSPASKPSRLSGRKGVSATFPTCQWTTESLDGSRSR